MGSTRSDAPTTAELLARIEELEGCLTRRRGLRRRLSRRAALIGASVLAALSLTGGVFASIPSAGGVISGCYLPASGLVRVIDTSSQSCRPTERAISWYATGAAVGASTLTGVLGIDHGGTGSATQNFVDLSSDQTVGGSKTFLKTISGNLAGNVTGNLSGNAGSVTNGVYTEGNQTINGSKTFTQAIQADITGKAGEFTGQLSGDVTGTQDTTSVRSIQGIPVSNFSPTGGQVLQFNDTTNQWEPTSPWTPHIKTVSKDDEAGIDGGNGFGNVDCPTGYAAIGGGVSGSTTGAYVVEGFPAEADSRTVASDGSRNTSWHYHVHNTDAFTTDNFTAYAICLKLSP